MSYTNEQINNVVQKVEKTFEGFTTVQNVTFCSGYIINGMKAGKTAEQISDDIYNAYKPLAFNGGLQGMMNYSAVNASNDMLNLVQCATGVLKAELAALDSGESGGEEGGEGGESGGEGGDTPTPVEGTAIEFTLGGLDGTVGSVNAGTETSNNSRIRSDFISLADNTIVYNATENTKYMLFFYSGDEEEKTYMDRTNWITDNSYTIPEGATYARVIVSKNDNTEIQESEITTIGSCIVLTIK